MRKRKEKDQAKKWNKKAHTYPRYGEEANSIEEQILSLAKAEGISFAGKTVLDIGCGTGRFTILIAKEAESVTGTDISENMLNIMEEDMKAEHIDNIYIICADWKDVPEDKNFDITMATLTPAFQKAEDFEKMIRMANDHVIYLGWANRKECNMVNEIFQMHDVEPTNFEFSNDLMDILATGRFKHNLIPVKDSWKRTGTIDEITERFIDLLEEYQAEPNHDAIRRKLLEYSPDGKIVTYITDVDLTLVLIFK